MRPCPWRAPSEALLANRSRMRQRHDGGDPRHTAAVAARQRADSSASRSRALTAAAHRTMLSQVNQAPSQRPGPGAPSRTSRWRERCSTRRSRIVCGSAYLLGWLAWCIAVYIWAGNHGHSSWRDGVKPTFILVAGVTFWPLACAHWWLTYPSEPRAMPWAGGGDD